MYELEYKPERLDWNEYFIRFKKTGAIRYYTKPAARCVFPIPGGPRKHIL